MDLRIVLLASLLAISASNAQDPDCCILEVWGECVIPCPDPEAAAGLISQKVEKIGQKIKLLSKAGSFPALKKMLALKKLAATKKLKGLTDADTCATCVEMITDFKSLLTSPEGVQYWDMYIEQFCVLLGMFDYDLEQECNEMVELESSVVIDMIVQEIDEQEICSMIFSGC